MKKAIPVIISFLFVVGGLRSQNFTWMRGSTASGATGNYGTQGTPSAANDPGGRHGCAKWVDASGNLWLFGGEGYSNSTTLCWMNDLWKYNVTTNQWTWVRGSNGPNAIGVYGTLGVAAASNEPGAREFPACWTDASGNFWMFGGNGFGTTSTFGKLNDLWKYNPASNQWTWVSGSSVIDQNGIYGTQGSAAPANIPGSRAGSVTWRDASGSFWLFGGKGLPATGTTPNYLNDLWKYNPTTQQWTWISGSTLTNQTGVYGTLGTGASSNIPGARDFPATWQDATGLVYIFGGRGYSATLPGYLNDFWKYDPVSNMWTWVGGANAGNQPGNYGSVGVSAATNMPGGRFASASWKDAGGNFYVFGGLGYPSTGFGRLNDVFRYSPATNQWTWLKGSNIGNVPGVYGTVGVPAATNLPGGRDYNTWWPETGNKFWLFGGEGFDANTTNPAFNHMNDLWSYGAPCNPDSLSVTPSRTICSGSSVSLTAYNQLPSTVTWYSSPTSTSVIASGSVFSVPTLTAASSQSVYTYYASSNGCSVTPRAVMIITVNPLPTLAILGPSVACVGNTITLTASGIGSLNYVWNTGSNSPTTSLLPALPGFTCILSGTDANGCENTVTKIITVLAPPTLTASATKTVVCTGESVVLSVNGASTYTWNTTPVQTNSSFTITPAITTTFVATGTGTNICPGTASIVVKVITTCPGIKEVQGNKNNFSIYPNPSKGWFNFTTINLPANMVLNIYNALGQKVFEQHISTEDANIHTSLTKGLYYYQVTVAGSNTGAGKLVIE